jgi:hypothetical protein
MLQFHPSPNLLPSREGEHIWKSFAITSNRSNGHEKRKKLAETGVAIVSMVFMVFHYEGECK